MTTVTLTRESAQQVLDALTGSNRFVWHYAHSERTTRIAESCNEAAITMRIALDAPAQPEQRLITIDNPDYARYLARHAVAPQTLARELSDAEIIAIGNRKATKYTHRSDPMYCSYGFVQHTLIDFARAVLAASKAPEQRLEPLHPDSWNVT